MYQVSNKIVPCLILKAQFILGHPLVTNVIPTVRASDTVATECSGHKNNGHTDTNPTIHLHQTEQDTERTVIPNKTSCFQTTEKLK